MNPDKYTIVFLINNFNSIYLVDNESDIAQNFSWCYYCYKSRCNILDWSSIKAKKNDQILHSRTENSDHYEIFVVKNSIYLLLRQILL